ncbi:Zn(2+)-responsive transcriptional regulator [Ferrimonas balearica]|uniref:Zn(2+)-responsive transcriptional regulator n=1 Tax=Ferrimonas balearica TaxID=44012 RepID=UPI001C992BB7|nr:Zn(2+)-responsive transcriptional regulator [Ferrimonas balearica]MBY5923135.1 Zn(2+)-responsive transcriptional regulator [Ferrimonas balearica]MBY5997489.1 Zn(2+)-responsive transcriptional regulator [Ferrimonas balearica]
MYRIGELAQRFEIKTDTLRYYEKHGLLSPSGRSDSGYRLYNDEDEVKLRFILRAKAVGFSLAQIQELLVIDASRAKWACQDVKGIVEKKVVELEQKIAELTQFRDSLQQLADACCGGPESAEHCSILEALEVRQ